ncbi:methyl-accepting chemotaxis protein [Shewanella zhangzhouensis]|uniref:methyl-accepting chemotaxis protein n=1 Tax=Shewanella zhangzhouensis TaxID=2864213 RepID=UPI001C65FFE0|nr:methyl-accepting chemotaxis protein [Shewanella zhangzhouensis]QYK04464.1 methyl-accepting chemotaxis protein [Shewanella zhangzhouensis]
MKIKVATRVIGGFSFVTLLLVILGGASLVTNNNLKDSTAIMQDLSMPALEATGHLSETLSEQQRLILKAFHSKNASAVPGLEKSFDQLSSGFNNQFSMLSGLLNNRDNFQGQLSGLKSSYQMLESNSKAMLKARFDSLSQQEELLKLREKLENSADDSSSNLFDLIDLESSQNQTEREIAAAAGAIDTTMTGIITTVYDLVAAEERSKYELIAKELDYMLGEVKTKMEYISRHGEGIIDADLVGTLNEDSTKVLKMLEGKDTLVTLKSRQIDSTQLASEKLTLVEKNAATVTEQMKRLAKDIETVTNDISNQALNDINNASLRTLILVVIAIVVAVVISFAVVSPLKRSLDEVNGALNVLASGDLTHKLDDTGHDEFAELSRNCNRLVDSLRSLIAGILDRSNQLAAAAEETSAITSQTTIGIQEQKSQVDQVATATTELSSSAHQVNMSADDALSQIKQADEETQHMRTIADENKRTILSLADEVAKASTVINKVHSDSASIGSILDVIRGIAEQTNLLALNAAIEAARAGEQGRGFAVVADEVRSLASRTQDSTREIQQMIEVLQQGTQQAVAVMQLGQNQAQSCVEKTEQANQALQTISHSVHKAYDAGTHIAQAAQEQNLVSQQVSEKLEHIAAISEETALGAEQTAKSSHEVARLAEELQSSVKEFRV